MRDDDERRDRSKIERIWMKGRGAPKSVGSHKSLRLYDNGKEQERNKNEYMTRVSRRRQSMDASRLPDALSLRAGSVPSDLQHDSDM